jgi:hypothetical protein
MVTRFENHRGVCSVEAGWPSGLAYAMHGCTVLAAGVLNAQVEQGLGALRPLLGSSVYLPLH